MNMRLVQPAGLALKKPAPWLGLLIAGGAAALFYLATASWIENEARQRFAAQARTAQNTIGTRIKSYTDLVRGAASVFRTAYPLTRTQFHEYVSGLDLKRNFAAVQAINVAEFVTDAELPDLVRRIEREHLAGDLPFQVKPPGKRPSYMLLTMIEPPVQMGKAFGLDITSTERGRATTIDESRDSGQLRSSGLPIRTVSRPNQTTLGLRLPLYRQGWALTSVAERRTAYIGSVGIAFSVPLLVQGALDELPIRDVRMTLTDCGLAGAADPQRLVIFDSSGTGQNPAPPLESGAGHFSTTLPIDYHGRLWEAAFSIRKSGLYSGFDVFFPWLAALAGFGGALLAHALLAALTSSRQRAVRLAGGMTRELRDSQARLQQAHQRLRRLAAHADRIKEGERKRIAREIHDDLGQNLLALRLEATMLAAGTRARHPRLHRRVQATLARTDATIASVRQIINDLRPLVLDLGLSAAVEWQLRQFGMRSGLACELVDGGHAIALDEGDATALFRILQESLDNIMRHAHASLARVELRLHEGRVKMRISDDGVGIAPEARHKPGAFGLVGIEERVSLLGGEFAISSPAGGGTVIEVSVPLSKAAGGPSPQ